MSLFYEWDEKRTIASPGNKEKTLAFAVDHWLALARSAIKDHGYFKVALSGGSTPKAIFSSFKPDQLDWSKVHLFWSDERSVSPENPDSNYKMAMDAGLSKLPIKTVHRMVAEKDIEENARRYEELIGDESFDLIMLGMGEDGHTASLFPGTEALDETERLVVANEVPQKNTFRMTMTFPCINRAKNVAIYVLGASKAEMVNKVFTHREMHPPLPIQQVKGLWILDEPAAAQLKIN